MLLLQSLFPLPWRRYKSYHTNTDDYFTQRHRGLFWKATPPSYRYSVTILNLRNLILIKGLAAEDSSDGSSRRHGWGSHTCHRLRRLTLLWGIQCQQTPRGDRVRVRLDPTKTPVCSSGCLRFKHCSLHIHASPTLTHTHTLTHILFMLYYI